MMKKKLRQRQMGMEREVMRMLSMVWHLPQRDVSLLRRGLLNHLWASLNLKDSNVFEYLVLVWSESLSEVVAVETDRSAHQ